METCTVVEVVVGAGVVMNVIDCVVNLKNLELNMIVFFMHRLFGINFINQNTLKLYGLNLVL